MSIFRAQKVNRILGGLAVMPWDVGLLNDDWLDAFSALVDDLPRAQAMVSAQEKSQAQWLKKQGYRGYLKAKR